MLPFPLLSHPIGRQNVPSPVPPNHIDSSNTDKPQSHYFPLSQISHQHHLSFLPFLPSFLLLKNPKDLILQLIREPLIRRFRNTRAPTLRLRDADDVRGAAAPRVEVALDRGTHGLGGDEVFVCALRGG